MLTASEQRTCCKCGESKDLFAFGRADPRCKPCRAADYQRFKAANPEKIRAQAREANRRHRAARTVYRRKSYTMSRFGLPPEQVDQFVRAYVDANGSHCSCCGVECAVVGGVKKPGLRRLVLDHDHRSGALRSMICDFCNTALGKLGDSPDGVRKLLAYIERYAK